MNGKFPRLEVKEMCAEPFPCSTIFEHWNLLETWNDFQLREGKKGDIKAQMVNKLCSDNYRSNSLPPYSNLEAWRRKNITPLDAKSIFVSTPPSMIIKNKCLILLYAYWKGRENDLFSKETRSHPPFFLPFVKTAADWVHFWVWVFHSWSQKRRRSWKSFNYRNFSFSVVKFFFIRLVSHDMDQNGKGFLLLFRWGLGLGYL